MKRGLGLVRDPFQSSSVLIHLESGRTSWCLVCLMKISVHVIMDVIFEVYAAKIELILLKSVVMIIMAGERENMRKHRHEKLLSSSPHARS